MDQAQSDQVKTAAQSDVGRVRSANQDCCGEFSNTDGYRLLVLADGMGGHAGGETASRLALETIGGVFQQGFEDPAAMLDHAFQAANQSIHQTGEADPSLHGMGTTGVALLIGPQQSAWVAHVGDSRAYRWRAGQLGPLTEDHSWIVDAVQAGRITAHEGMTHPMRNVLMRSIGISPSLETSISKLDLKAGDRLLLCSDGLWGEVSDASIAEILSEQIPENAVRQLVDLANENGGADNITVQVAEILGPFAERPSAPSPSSHQAVASTPSAPETPASVGRPTHKRKLAVVAGLTLISLALLRYACA